MTNDDLSARAFGASFKDFLEQAATGVPAEELGLLGAAPRSISASIRPGSRS